MRRSCAHPLEFSAESDVSPAKAVVFEPVRLERCRLEEIPPVDDDRGSHQRTDPIEVQRLELLPVGEDQQRVSVLSRLVGRVDIAEAVISRTEWLQTAHGGGVMDL